MQDVWNYINRECNDADGWVQGKNILLETCNPNVVACMNFESSPEKATQYFNRTWTLPNQSYCVIKVDATLEVARVVFDSTSYLGVEEEGYQIGDVITVESGVKEVTIYNGVESGQLTFLISFSGAYDALSKVAAFTVAATLVNLI